MFRVIDATSEYLMFNPLNICKGFNMVGLKTGNRATKNTTKAEVVLKKKY